MNILLFDNTGMVDDSHIVVTDERVVHHLKNVLKVEINSTVKIGRINGNRGSGVIEKISPSSLTIRIDDLTSAPPLPLPCTLIMAMPRPKVFRRTLHTAVTMGVKQVYLIKTWRVDKNYFDSPLLQGSSLRHECLLALEQGGDTLLPEIHIRKFFKPFIEDEVPGLINDRRGILAHPGSSEVCPGTCDGETLLAIGPEGGFISYELEKFAEVGFSAVALGDRILRVEQAVPVFLSRLFY